MTDFLRPKMEFHISRQARDQYKFDQSLFTLSGNVIFANFLAVRLFAQKMNEQRDLVRFPDQAVRAGQLNAMGLIDEIIHLVFRSYRQQRNPAVLKDALEWFSAQVGVGQLEATLRAFCDDFPPLTVYQGRLTLDEYMAGETDGVPNRQIAFEEMTLLWLANINPAFAPFQELFDDSKLRRNTSYSQITARLRDFFSLQPGFGASNQNLIDMLRAPALAKPDSLFAQLEFIRLNWTGLVDIYLIQLLSSLDLIREEEKPVFGFGGQGPALVYEFHGMEAEPEAFSQDLDWMPNLVLLAKNSYVWLDQLSKKYQRPIHRLDEIPEGELEQLARWGFTGLWLIGVWERSKASQTIKQLRGNPEAVASAYSLYDYQVAQDLGGPPAFQSLRERAWRYGIRLASDMVPNHMGIDSRWVIEHPDWFIGLDYSPFPTYSFNGPDLSSDQRVAIFIEDHYYNNSDAAVVFKRLDKWTGSAKYIYHGNDGTAMPWNDTAQLNYLLPQVREAVIQTIMHVARQFPIIRFDAAMTLAKKHFQRLWYPEPGSGGDIPSRAEHGLTKDQLDAVFPVEFWREVVDRVAQEVPDTLLLAEAFWLMEGYFVRSLGMHRVYNSAFMNMLRDEKNAEYRLVIKNTLEFDREILKRYVNFMNNPDERTAVDQFGKGDKYFGTCIMMVTLPGLPMIGHGQLEGFTEKYGMEYRRAYWDEQVDGDLVERHIREIFPLMRRRRLFAEVENFLLYDLYTSDGSVNEDVFAYSNRVGEDRSLVLVHNRFQTARGWIKTSAAYSVKTESGDRTLLQKNLGDGLGLEYSENVFTIFKDQITGLEYLRNNREIHERGLYVDLDAYKYRIFLDFRQVHDNDLRQYANLAAYLQGGGVPSIQDAIKEKVLEPVLTPFRELVNPAMLQKLIDNRVMTQRAKVAKTQASLEEVEARLLPLLAEIHRTIPSNGEYIELGYSILHELTTTLYLPVIDQLYPDLAQVATQPSLGYLEDGPAPFSQFNPTQDWLGAGNPAIWGPTLSWVFLHQLGKLAAGEDYREVSHKWMDDLFFGKVTAAALGQLTGQPVERSISLIKILTRHHLWWAQAKERKSASPAIQSILLGWLNDGEVQRWIGINRFEGVIWFNKESFEELVWWFYLVAVIGISSQESDGAPEELPAYVKELSRKANTAPRPETPSSAEDGSVPHHIARCYATIAKIIQAARLSGFQVEKLVDLTGNL